MAWKFDPILIDIIWIANEETLTQVGTMSFGNVTSLDPTQLSGDLYVDTGDRTNDNSILDQGLRVI